MQEFEAPLFRIKVEAHPNADRLEIVRFGDYQMIVPLGQFTDGDVAIYIPEASVCPDDLIAEMGLTGRLAGSRKNRVKAVRLRGVLSQGLVYPITGERLKNLSPANFELPEGKDYGGNFAANLGLVKYEPPIPTHLKGVIQSQVGKTLKYSVLHLKRYPHIFDDGEPVLITEKIHGTLICVGYRPSDPDLPWVVHSKGMGGQGVCFKLGDEDNLHNTYVRMWRQYRERFAAAYAGAVVHGLVPEGQPLYFMGEVHGRGIQDLHYGLQQHALAIFDIWQGEPHKGKWLNPGEVNFICLGTLPTVPLLYNGAYSKAIVERHTKGETLGFRDEELGTQVGVGMHIREGCVIRPRLERTDLEIGRVILKSVSDDYLTRHGGTEHN